LDIVDLHWITGLGHNDSAYDVSPFTTFNRFEFLAELVRSLPEIIVKAMVFFFLFWLLIYIVNRAWLTFRGIINDA